MERARRSAGARARRIVDRRNRASALAPGGVLLLDVYNSLLWHGAENDEEDEEESDGDSAAAAADDGESDDASLLVRVQDEDERDWTVYEREPAVDSEAQRITCAYDFHEAPAADGGAEAAVFTETLVHQYLLPEQLVRLVDASGLAIEEIFGGFDAEATFDPVESEHVVVVARRKAAEPEAA